MWVQDWVKELALTANGTLSRVFTYRLHDTVCDTHCRENLPLKTELTNEHPSEISWAIVMQPYKPDSTYIYIAICSSLEYDGSLYQLQTSIYTATLCSTIRQG